MSERNSGIGGTGHAIGSGMSGSLATIVVCVLTTILLVAGPVNARAANLRAGASSLGQSSAQAEDAAALVGVRLVVGSSVPAQVSAENGPIARGDLLVAGSQPGFMVRASAGARVGAILGKAQGSLTRGTGVINIQETVR